MARVVRQLWFQLLVAIVLGVVAGLVLHGRASVLGELGGLVVRLLKALATPLVFCAVVDAIARAPLSGKMGLRLRVVCLVNTTVAALLAIGLALGIAPGLRVDRAHLPTGAPAQHAATSVKRALDGIVPESLAQPFVDNGVLAVVLLALGTGAALRKLGDGGERLRGLVGETLALLQLVLHAVVRVVPLAIFGVVARVVGESGFELFRALFWLVVTVTIGLVVHVTLYYSLLLRISGRSPFAFWRAASGALLTALSTGSSMATLPFTLRTLDAQGVNPRASRLAACVATNFNNDGIMLYEVVAAIFVAQITGHALTPSVLVMLCATSAFAAAGIAGVPEAGLITLALVLEAAHLPTELLPPLLAVDWLLGRLRATTNVASDLTVSALLDPVPRSSVPPASPAAILAE